MPRSIPALPFGLPPMSDSFARLLSLSENERNNVRLLELLVQKDPVAIARLLQLANSAYFRRGSRVESVSGALQVIGCETAVFVLMGLWTIEELAVPPTLLAPRAWLARHAFSLCATIRRLLHQSQADEGLSFVDLHLSALIDKIALASTLSIKEERMDLRETVLGAVRAECNALHQIPELSEVFERSIAIADAWDLGGGIKTSLVELNSWRVSRFNLGVTGQSVLIGELLLAEATAHPDTLGLVLDEAYEQSTLMHQLVHRRVDPTSLVVRF